MGSSLVLNRRPKAPAEDTAAFGAIAERFRRGGALEQAVSLCRDGLRKFPDHVSARVTLGWALLDLGRYEEARIELEQVMRRAPDNLAAIRGMAELHDRFEHTLNLPMDGPGEWPPPAASIDDDAEPVDRFRASVAAADADDAMVATAPAMVPADMGLPLWTPGPAASEVVEAVANTQIQIEAPSSGAGAFRRMDAFAGAPVPVSDEPARVADNAAIELTMLSAEPAAAPAVTLDVVAEQGSIDASLAELIAEAETLDAVADLEAGELQAVVELPDADVPVVELGAAELVELEPLQPSEFAVADEAPIELVAAEADAFGLPGPIELDAPALALETEPVLFELAAPEISEFNAVDAEAERYSAAFAAAEVEAVTDLSSEAGLEVAAQTEAVTVLSAEAEPDVLAQIEAVTERPAEAEPVVVGVAAAFAEAAVAAEAEAAVAVEAEAAVAVEAEAAVAVEAEAAVAVEAEAAHVVEPEAPADAAPEGVAVARPEPEFVPQPAAAMAETPAPVAELLPFVRPSPDAAVAEPIADAVSQSRRRTEATVAALEQILRRVHARRRELMAESVA